MVSTLHDDERRDTPAIGTDALDYGNPFAIARLDLLSFAVTVGARNDHRGRDLTHHEAGLVEVVDILILDTVLSLQVREKREPARDILRIFVKGPLVVVYTRKTRPKV